MEDNIKKEVKVISINTSKKITKNDIDKMVEEVSSLIKKTRD